jgi:signal transduction histidine kinase
VTDIHNVQPGASCDRVLLGACLAATRTAGLAVEAVAGDQRVLAVSPAAAALLPGLAAGITGGAWLDEFRDRTALTDALLAAANGSPSGPHAATTRAGFRLRLTFKPLAGGGVVVDIEDRTALDATRANLAAVSERARVLQHQLFEHRTEAAALLAEFTDTLEQQRRDLALTLHDGPVQQMIAVLVQLSMLVDDHDREPHHPVDTDRLRSLVPTLRDAVSSTRHVIHQLHSPALEAAGIVDAIWAIVDELRNAGIDVHLDDGLAGERFDSRLEALVYRNTQELLRNVVKHAAATRVGVRVWVSENGAARCVHVQVSDDGVGFDPDAAARHPVPGHVGLPSVRRSVTAIGGDWQVSSAPGEGTTVRFSVPVAQADRRNHTDTVVQAHLAP